MTSGCRTRQPAELLCGQTHAGGTKASEARSTFSSRAAVANTVRCRHSAPGGPGRAGDCHFGLSARRRNLPATRRHPEHQLLAHESPARRRPARRLRLDQLTGALTKWRARQMREGGWCRRCARLCGAPPFLPSPERAFHFEEEAPSCSVQPLGITPLSPTRSRRALGLLRRAPVAPQPGVSKPANGRVAQVRSSVLLRRGRTVWVGKARQPYPLIKSCPPTSATGSRCWTGSSRRSWAASLFLHRIPANTASASTTAASAPTWAAAVSPRALTARRLTFCFVGKKRPPIHDALAQWRADKPAAAVVEIVDSAARRAGPHRRGPISN